VLTGTEAWRSGDRAAALEQAFLELDRRMALPEHRAELAELAGAQADEDMQCGAPAPARPAQRGLSQRGLSQRGLSLGESLMVCGWRGWLVAARGSWEWLSWSL
jgi:hypothetical protein